MYKSKNRLLSVLLVLTIVASLLEGFAIYAGAVTDYGIQVNGVTVTSDNCNSYRSSDNWWYVAPTESECGKLYLDGATLNSYALDSYYTSTVYSQNDLEVIVQGSTDSVIFAPTSSAECNSGIRCLGKLTVTCNANLTINTQGAGITGYGILAQAANAGTGSYKTVTVQGGGELTVNVASSVRTRGITGNVTVYDATVTVNCSDYLTESGTSYGVEGSLKTASASSVVSVTAGDAPSGSTVTKASYGCSKVISCWAGTLTIKAYRYVAPNTLNTFNYKFPVIKVSSTTSPSDAEVVTSAPDLSQRMYLSVTPNTSYDVWVGATQVTASNALDVLGNGKVSFVLGEYDVPAVLNLNGASITQAKALTDMTSSIYCACPLNIVLTGTNSILPSVSSGSDNRYTVFASGTLTLSGTGTLNVSAMPTSLDSAALYSSTVNITESCCVNATGAVSAAASSVVKAPTAFTMTGSGTLSLTAASGSSTQYAVKSPSITVSSGHTEVLGNLVDGFSSSPVVSGYTDVVVLTGETKAAAEVVDLSGTVDYGKYVYITDTIIINSVSATGITAPANGQAPDYTCTVPTGYGYTLSQVTWTYPGGTVASGDTFMSDITYYVNIYLTPSAGYSFADASAVSATVDGAAATVTKYGTGIRIQRSWTTDLYTPTTPVPSRDSGVFSSDFTLYLTAGEGETIYYAYYLNDVGYFSANTEYTSAGISVSGDDGDTIYIYAASYKYGKRSGVTELQYNKGCVVTVTVCNSTSNIGNAVVKLYSGTMTDAAIRADMNTGAPALALNITAAAGYDESNPLENYNYRSYRFPVDSLGTYKVGVYKAGFAVKIITVTLTAADPILGGSAWIYALGNPTNSGYVSSDDSTAVLGYSVQPALDTDAYYACDVNRDGVVDALDAISVQLCVNNGSVSFEDN